MSLPGGELSDDESLWEGLPQSDQRPDHDDLMDGIEKMVRDTMSDVFASREEKGKFATSAPIQVPRRYSEEAAVPRNISLVGYG